MEIRKTWNIAISIVVGVAIAWFLLSKVEPRDIPRAVSRIPPWDLVLGFLLYTSAVFFKSARFKVILRAGISLKKLFPIVSLYMFLANVLPMRTGELSYLYLLKKEADTPGTKSFASLIAGGIADVTVILIAMLVVGWHLRDVLLDRFMSLQTNSSSGSRIWDLVHSPSLMIILGLLMVIFAGLALLRVRKHYLLIIRAKFLEVVRELANVTLDVRLLGIIALSILIISFRFITQWYLVQSMGLAIGIWEFSFALIFGALFSLIPVHGPAGFGTVEAPWVLSLVYLNVPKEDAIISGFCLHILIMLFCMILGLCSAIVLFWLRKSRKGEEKCQRY